MNNRRSQFLYAALSLLLAAGGFFLLTVPMRGALYPHAKLLHLLFGAPFAFEPEVGYLSPALGIAITRNCSGAKLYACAFLLLAFGFPALGGHIRRIRRLALYALLALPGAVLLSVLRIALSVPFCRMEKGALIHTLISLSIHFGALAALYAAMYIKSRREGGQTHETSR